MAFVKIYVYTSFVFWEVVGINRAVTGNALIENALILQSSFSMILPTESKGKLGNAGERVPFLVKLQPYSLQQRCQK